MWVIVSRFGILTNLLRPITTFHDFPQLDMCYSTIRSTGTNRRSVPEDKSSEVSYELNDFDELRGLGPKLEKCEKSLHRSRPPGSPAGERSARTGRRSRRNPW